MRVVGHELAHKTANRQQDLPLRRRSRPAYFLFLFLLMTLTVLVAEFGILPQKLDGLSREAYLMGFAAKPGTLVDDVRINSMGFTGHVIAGPRAPGTVRILTLGGSAMFNRRMTERIIERLDTSTDTPIEVLGAALRTHTTWSSLLKYELLARYGFDFVLIYHGVNDLWANHASAGSFRSDYSQLGPWYTRNFLLDRSLIAREVYNRWIYSNIGLIESRGLPRTNQAGFAAGQTFRHNLSSLVERCVEHGAVPILMTFAWSLPPHYSYQAFAERRMGYNNPMNYDRFPVELWGQPEYVREGLRRNNEMVREIAASGNVPLIDQEQLIGKDLRRFGDVCHLSEEGTERFVDNIVDFFLRDGLVQENTDP